MLLAVAVAVPVVLVPLVDPRPVLALWLAATLGAVLAGGLRLRRLLRAQVPFLGFAASVLCVNAVTRDGGTVAVLGPLAVTDTGLATGAALALRTLVVGVAAVTMLAVVDPGRLLTSLHVVGRLPAQATVALMVAHRVVQDLPGDWATVRRAQALRGPTVRWARPARHLGGGRGRRGGAATVRLPGDVRSVGAAAFALLATTIRRAERMAVVLETRGYGALPAAERTTWHEARVGARDAVLAVVVLGACLAAVAAGQAP
ncbi:energy-coupling factor transporter transmembrane component T [Actinotalea sp. AC32]|nr:energy-coupling factor transporter transmembrane component T [Actinotalea sp. AC32]